MMQQIYNESIATLTASLRRVKIDRQKAIIKVIEKDITDYYKFGETIGIGGFGKVYKVVHKETGAIRAVKRLKKKGMDQENQKYILSEYEALKKLDHPNIVKLIDRFEDKDNIFFV